MASRLAWVAGSISAGLVMIHVVIVWGFGDSGGEGGHSRVSAETREMVADAGVAARADADFLPRDGRDH
jgi:hypothetical protein